MKMIGFAGNSARDRMEVARLLANVTSGTYHVISIAHYIYTEVEQAYGLDVQTMVRFNAFWGGTKPRDALKIVKCLDDGFIAFAKAEKINIYLPKSLNAITKLWGRYRRKQNPDYFIERIKHDMHEYIKHPFNGFFIIDVKTQREADFVTNQCRGRLAYIKNAMYPSRVELETLLPWLSCIIESTADKDRMIEQVIEMKEMFFLEENENVVS